MPMKLSRIAILIRKPLWFEMKRILRTIKKC
jgi:hypothetical protein